MHWWPFKANGQLIMEYDLNPADKDNDGNTALHIAAMKGHVETDT